MWFGTGDGGLNRYDGNTVKVFKHNSADSNSIPHNTISNITEDDEHLLWVSTGDGVYRFDPLTEKGTTYYHDTANPNSIISNDRPFLFFDSKKRFWLSSPNGIQQFDYKTKKCINYNMPPISNPAWQAGYNRFGTMIEDSKHRLWAISGYGLYLIDEVNHVLKPYYTGQFVSLTGVYEDKKKQIWVGTWGAGGWIKKFNPDDGTYENHFVECHLTIGFNEWEDENKNNWLIFFTDRSLVLFDAATEEFQLYAHQINDPFSISGQVMGKIFKDEKNRLWIPTNGGVDIIDPLLQHFENHMLYKDMHTEYPDDYGLARSFLETDNEYWVSAWYALYLNKYDKNWKLKTVEKHVPPASRSFFSQCINTMQKDDQGNIWYGTDTGLVKQSGSKYTMYVPKLIDDLDINNLSSRGVLKRKDGLYWARFYKGGLYVLDDAKGVFLKNYRSQLKGSISFMAYDHKQRFWVSTYEGIYHYDEKADSFIQHHIDYGNKRDEEAVNTINSFYCDENNILWLCSYNGLIKFDPATYKSEVIDESKGLPVAIIYKSLQDTTGKIWIVGANGLIEYNKQKHSFRYFTPGNGLPLNFLGGFGMFHFNSKGNILLGTDGIVTEFNPYTLSSNNTPPAVLFSDIMIDGKRIVYTENEKKEKHITLLPGQMELEVHFSVLNYSAPQQNKFYYRLIGIDSTWHTSANGNLSYLSLAPGGYTLQIKGSNNDGIMNEAGDKLYITVQPHWWQTLWFKLALVLIAAIVIIGFVQWKIRNIKAKDAVKQQMSELEVKALRARMSPHFIFNAMNSIQQFTLLNDVDNANRYISKFSKLLRKILHQSESNTILLSDEIETLKLYLDIESLRLGNDFKYAITTDNETEAEVVRIPVLLVQPFVENAIHHGLVHKEGEKNLTVKFMLPDEYYLVCEVTDNGVGRERAGILKQRREPLPGNESKGMKMVEERLKLLDESGQKTTIKIEDVMQDGEVAGTRVTIIIPQS